MINLTHKARNFLNDLESKQFKQVVKKIFSLLRDPYPNDCKHLSGHPGFRRIDVGEFRICYEYRGEIIYIAVVGRRNDDEVYKELKRKND